MAEYVLYIPPKILHNKGIGAAQKLLLAYITKLHNDGLECFASNKHLSNITGLHESHIPKQLTQLEKRGILSIEERDGKRYITPKIEY